MSLDLGGGNRLVIDPHGATTIFSDGAMLRAEPQDDAAYRERAAAHGYGADTYSLSVEHEFLHTALALMLGLPWSPTLRGQVEPADAVPGGVQWAEEAAVLSIQTFANRLRAAGVTVPALAGVERARGRRGR